MLNTLVIILAMQSTGNQLAINWQSDSHYNLAIDIHSVTICRHCHIKILDWELYR